MQDPQFEMPEFEKKTFADLRAFSKTPRGQWPAYYEVKTVVPEQEVEDVVVTYANHATFLVQTADYNILIDPIWSEYASPVSFAGPKRVHNPYIDFEDLPAIDYVLVTHSHYDHLDIPTLKKLNKRFAPEFVVGLELDKLLYRHLGKNTRVTALNWGQSVDLSAGQKIIFETAFHWSKRGLFDYNDTLWGSFVLELDGKTLYHSGDTGYWKHFAELGEKYDIDFAMLSLGDYEPRWFMKQSHMNPAEALKAMRDLGAESAVGMHFGTFQLASNSYQDVLDDFSSALSDSENADFDFVLPTDRDSIVYYLK